MILIPKKVKRPRYRRVCVRDRRKRLRCRMVRVAAGSPIAGGLSFGTTAAVTASAVAAVVAFALIIAKERHHR